MPYQAFEASDGLVVIGAGNDKLFGALMTELGCPELADDPRFQTNALRVANRDDLVELIEAATRARTVAEWVECLGKTGVAVAPVNRIDQVFEDPHVKASGQVVSVSHPTVGELALVGPAVHLEVTSPEVRLAPPLLGQHTDEVLFGVLKKGEAEIQDLRRRGVI